MNMDELAVYLQSIGFGGAPWAPHKSVKHGPLFYRTTSDQSVASLIDLTVTTNMLAGPIKTLLTQDSESLIVAKRYAIFLSAADGQIISSPEIEEARASFGFKYNERGDTGDIYVPASPWAIGTGYDFVETTQTTAADGEAAVAAPRGWGAFAADDKGKPKELRIDCQLDNATLEVLNAIGSGTVNVLLALDAYAIRKEDLRQIMKGGGCPPGGKTPRGSQVSPQSGPLSGLQTLLRR